MSDKIALITGITGQDGSFLAELLLEKGYGVYGIIRRSSSFNTGRIEHLYVDPHEGEKARMRLHYADMTDPASIRDVLEYVRPDEIYHLAAQSHVGLSFDQPAYACEVAAMGTLHVLAAVRQVEPGARVYYAGTSEQFGDSPPPQNESTLMRPRSPYAIAKCFGFEMCRLYREAYGMHISAGILFNHESERRGETFLTRKVTRGVGRIKLGLQDKLYLGDMTTSRDWGFAGDYVRAMWLMLQQDHPTDYVIATGESHTVGELIEIAFQYAGLDWRQHIRHDPKYLRPMDIPELRGDSCKARTILGWERSMDFGGLIRRMVDHDLILAEGEKILLQKNAKGAKKEACRYGNPPLCPLR